MNPEGPGAQGPGAREAADARLVELRAEERYARERYQLYKARAYGSRPTSPGRLRELERRSVLAKRRLDRARAAGEYHAEDSLDAPRVEPESLEPPSRTPPTPDRSRRAGKLLL
jgi:hypothetical protein